MNENKENKEVYIRWEIAAQIIVKSYGSSFYFYYFSAVDVVIDAAVEIKKKMKVHRGGELHARE